MNDADWKQIQECYRILEVEPGTPPDQVRASYLELVKIWHPDRFANDAKLLARATRRLQEINSAYDRLKVEGYPYRQQRRREAPPSNESQPTPDPVRTPPTPSPDYRARPFTPSQPSPVPSTLRSPYFLLAFVVSGAVAILIIAAPKNASHVPEQRATSIASPAQGGRGQQPVGKGPVKPIPVFDFSAEQRNQYLAGFRDPYVSHLRKALSSFYDSNLTGIDPFALPGLQSFDRAYFKSPFVLVSYADQFGGGRTILIIFRDRPDRLFRAWVFHGVGTSGGEYWLREFHAVPTSRNELDALLKGLKNILKDPALAL